MATTARTTNATTAAAITTIDRNTLKLLTARVVAALGPLAAELGVSITPAGGTFGIDGNTAAVIKLSVRTENVEAATAAAKAEWDRYCVMYGLRPEVFGMRFTTRGTAYTVTGLATGRSKKVVKTTTDAGKVYVWEASSVRTLTKTTEPDGYGRLTFAEPPEAPEADAFTTGEWPTA